jgi:hypothetical protein
MAIQGPDPGRLEGPLLRQTRSRLPRARQTLLYTGSDKEEPAAT